MSKSLLIVESPAKAKTLNRYLGKDFSVLASNGHVRDLLPKSGAVDTEHDFAMRYQIIEKNAKSVDFIARAMQKADTLYLATDPDREGEAISWHLYELLKDRGVLKNKQVKRVVFHEVTRTAIDEAMRRPRGLSADLIDAQQARRALDYLVGFNLSPLLWKKIHRGLSAGRVQSPALRMIVEREEEIEQFKAREYWTIEAALKHGGMDFKARLTQLAEEKVKQFTLTTTAAAGQAVRLLEEAAGGRLMVEKITKKQRKKQPAPPFITSTLQQEAVRKLGLTAQNTMRIAQQLYEGIDTGEGAVGLITYMRTDSVTLAREAIDDIRDYIAEVYGEQARPAKPRVFKTRARNAQEAHEAIRPTSIRRLPKALKARLTRDQLRLYELIWKRTLASQMANALIDTVAVDLACGDQGLFRANGATIVSQGFMQVYAEEADDKRADEKADEKALPAMSEGEAVHLAAISPQQHFTEPPPRYTEASLVKSLEDYGIGRPSTYASIISTLRNREYVDMDRKRFVPTDVGRTVNRFLTEHFTDYVDYEFTARLEDQLDAVSRGESKWLPLMQAFWKPFAAAVKDKEENVSRSDAAQARALGADPETGLPVSVRMGRYGPYVQIGSKDDEEKPRFAGLRPGQRMDSISLAEAMALFKLPRALGSTEEDGEIVIGIGRFGPYVRYGSKFVSIPKDDDPYSISLERALELVKAKKKADAERHIKAFDDQGIAVLNGRYGPYVTDGKRNAKIPKDADPKALSLADCQRLLAAAPASRRRGRAAARPEQARAAGHDSPAKDNSGNDREAGKKTARRAGRKLSKKAAKTARAK